MLKIISSDSHISEPPDLWTSRMDHAFRDRGPRVVGEDDADWWYCDGQKVISFHGGGAQLGVRFKDPQKMSRLERVDSVIPGAYIPEARIKDLDQDGIYGEILYPTAGGVLYHWLDDELLTVVCRAYNDWLAGFCKAQPKRFCGLAMLNTDNVEEAVNELKRCAKLGLGGGLISVYPQEQDRYDHPKYEPLWAAAEALNMPLAMHINTFRRGQGQGFSDEVYDTASFRVNSDHWVRMSIGHMIFSGVFERHPNLRVGAVEFEVAWAAHFIERMDYIYSKRAYPSRWHHFGNGMLPSGYFHQNVFLSFQEDALGVRLRDVIGLDTLMWGSDYPHPESTFPRTQEILQEVLKECPLEEKGKIVGGNAARVYSNVFS